MDTILDLDNMGLVYYGDDLGANYKKEYTLFKVWAPTREEVRLVIYDRYSFSQGKIYPMIKKEKGIWELKLGGDFKNRYYNYIVKTDDGLHVEIQDPYAKGAGINGAKGMIVDFNDTNPRGWEHHSIPNPVETIIIYEIHVRDFSININAGIRNRGKYLAFTEGNTKGINGITTGIDHLKELGITHVHLQPVFDFGSVDETKDMEYNWGYDPHLYNVIEGSYSTNPYDGKVRIREFKEMIKSLHENGIGVIMDVVYNHTYKLKSSPFDILVPKYYYRTWENGEYSNGSGCGNETASERKMMRKFIIDSVKFWAREYKIDGFRFDLMALHDIVTMEEVERELKEINKNILIYGEPWTSGPSPLPIEDQFKKGSQRSKEISLFNDDFRNAIKGDNDGIGKGFVNGGWGLEDPIKIGIAGSIDYGWGLQGFAERPRETINYVSSHDNLTLYDKIKKSNPEATKEQVIKMNRLALAIIFTSQGIPFINGGTEFLRTKKGCHNSYNAGDEINNIDWDRKNRYIDTFRYIKGLIELRKSQKAMVFDEPQDVRDYLHFLESPENTVGFVLNSPYEGDYKHMVIIHNASVENKRINLPIEGKWKVIANEYEVNQDGVSKGQQIFNGEVDVPFLSSYILYKI